MRSDRENNDPVLTDGCDISFRNYKDRWQVSGDPKHDTVGGSVPAIYLPNGHKPSSTFGLDGSDYLYAEGNNHKDDFSFMDRDYTIDYWVRFSSVTGDRYMFSFPCPDTGDNHFGCNLNGSNFRFGPFTVAADGYINVTHGCSVDTWYHLALVRFGNIVTLYKNGTSMASVTQSANRRFQCTGNAVWGAHHSGAAIFQGFMAEMRVSNGIARWTGNFPVPKKAYF